MIVFTPYNLLNIFPSNQKQNITDAALDLVASWLLHFFLLVTQISINLFLPISHTSLFPMVCATMVHWVGLTCTLRRLKKKIIYYKPMLSLGFTFLSFSVCISNLCLSWQFILAIYYPYLFHGKLNTLFIFCFLSTLSPFYFSVQISMFFFLWISISEHGQFCSDPCKVSYITFFLQVLQLRDAHLILPFLYL